MNGSATLSYAPAMETVDNVQVPKGFWFNGLDPNDTIAVNGKTVTVTIVSGPTTNNGEWYDGNTDTALFPDKPNATMTGDVEVTYLTHVGDANILYSTNRDSVIGEAFMRWPIYSANADCADSAIKGYVELHVFRCRVTQGPGFDSSYKSAQTNQCTFSAVDSKRADDACFSVAYFELAGVESQQGG